MLKTILTLSISWALASAALAEQPAPVQSAQSLRRAVALLDYVAGDYGRAVGPGGEVLSPDEFKEQQQFVLEAAREVRDDAGPAGEDLVTRLQALHSRVAARASPAEVSMAARALRDEIVQRFKVALLPVHPPDLARGRALYAESCAACHGADGHAPPKEAHELSTQPPSFAVSAEVEELAPQRIFSATTYGVPNTAMPGYEDALDDAQRWDLAYFVLSLAHRTPADVRRGISLARAALIEGGYREIATQSDAALRARLAAAGLSGPDAEVALASLRAGPFSEEDAKGAGLAEVRRDLARALAQANAGDRDGARRTIISGYLDHLEPHEPAMRARDAQMVSEIEREFLALRSSLDGPKGGGRSKGGGDTEAIVRRACARGRHLVGDGSSAGGYFRSQARVGGGHRPAGHGGAAPLREPLASRRGEREAPRVLPLGARGPGGKLRGGLRPRLRGHLPRDVRGGALLPRAPPRSSRTGRGGGARRPVRPGSPGRARRLVPESGQAAAPASLVAHLRRAPLRARRADGRQRSPGTAGDRRRAAHGLDRVPAPRARHVRDARRHDRAGRRPLCADRFGPLVRAARRLRITGRPRSRGRSAGVRRDLAAAVRRRAGDAAS
ncbi:MAG: cytochrome c [Deltaproteobacteria bacterium]|nr:MAG: cytochrome c [Deltaproteobacteria bacterium]